MATLMLEGCGNCELVVRRTQNLSTALTANRITIDEFTYNLAISLVAACNECMKLCVDAVPAQFLTGSFACLERLLKTVDFMPCPKPFIAGVGSDEEVEETKRRLRPKYVQLYQMMERRIADVAAERVQADDLGSPSG